MADHLAINIKAHEWRMVREFVGERIGELTERCIAVRTPTAERELLVARIDELKRLLDAPMEAARQAEMEPDPDKQQRGY